MSRYILSEHEQGSDLWKLDRAGKATGSRASDILAKIKTGEAAARRDYRIQLVTERLTGTPVENGFVSKDMEHGIQQEPFARMAYEAATGIIVREAGFAYLPDIQAGCSVDGLLEDDGREGILEIKCPKSATHIAYVLGNRIPPAYLPQITHNLWITGAMFADFVSFDQRLPEHLQLFRKRIEWTDVDIQAHKKEVLMFLKEVDELVNKLSEKHQEATSSTATC